MKKLVLSILGSLIAMISLAQSTDENVGAIINAGLPGQRFDGIRIPCAGCHLYRPIVFNPEHAQSQQRPIVYIPMSDINAPKFSYNHRPDMTGWQAAGYITLGLARVLAFPYSTEYNLDK